MDIIRNIEDLFIHEIQVLWSAEKMLVEQMPAMIEKATNIGLKKLLALHHAETQQHQTALEAICRQLEIDPAGDFNPGIEGILKEGQMVMAKDATPEGLDAAIIAGAQKVEHYEISGYGSAAHYAELLGYHAIAKRLRLTLEEEQQADTKLNAVARNLVNPIANSSGIDRNLPVTQEHSPTTGTDL